MVANKKKSVTRNRKKQRYATNEVHNRNLQKQNRGKPNMGRLGQFE